MYRDLVASIYEGCRNVRLTIKVVVFGDLKSGARFESIVNITYDPKTENIEQALIRHYHSQARDFYELVIEQEWRHATWTY